MVCIVKRPQLPVLALAVVMAGCTTANVQSEPPAQLSAASQSAAGNESDKMLNAVEQLSNRLTAVQEQVLNVRSQSARQLEQLQNLQVILHTFGQDLKVRSAGSESDSVEGQPSAEEFALLLDQMAQTANDITMQLQDGNFRFVSSYTETGQWILIRYDRYSGESWMADNGVWVHLKDPIEVAPSIYEIKVDRADADVKGFVAARLDRQTGDVWWLKQNRWQRLEK